MVDPAVQRAAEHWIAIDEDPETRAAVQALIAAKNDAELTRMFGGKRIQFGTAGLRAKLEPGYQGLNTVVIRQTAQGLCDEILRAFPRAKERGVIVGYDHRVNSRRFAELTADVMLARGVTVYLFPGICPTPYVAYGVPLLGCVAGVMVTPSHNPPGDNGYKVYWENGAQIIPPVDRGIQTAIDNNLEFWPEVVHGAWKTGAIDCGKMVEAAYMARARRELCWHAQDNAKTPLRVVFTPMHGVGKNFTTRVLREWSLPQYIPVAEQIESDPHFPTVKFPNPEEPGALSLAMKTAEANGCPIVVAEDPDSDRFAAAERQADGSWKVFTGNELALLLGHWALIHFPREKIGSGLMLASTVSSKILQGMANHPEDGGFLFEETLTGFKWMGNRAVEQERHGRKLIFAFEVEIGFLMGDMSFDKDGVRALACFYEMAAQLYAQGKTCTSHLEYLYSRYGYYVMVNSYFRGPNIQAMDAVFARLRKDGKYATEIGGHKVLAIRDLTTGYDSSRPDGKATLHVDPSSHMITYTLEKDAVLTLRTSGTEPKLKYYVETVSKTSREHAKRDLDIIVQDIIDSLIMPTAHGLEPPPKPTANK